MAALKLPKQKTIEGPASIIKRTLAFIIDILLINIVIMFPFRDFFSSIPTENLSFAEAFTYLNSPEFQSTTILLSIFSSILSIMYFMILEGKYRQSVGKILMKLRIKSNTKELTFLQNLGRNMYLIPIFPFIILWIIDPMFILFTKERKRLSEIISKTEVVQNYNY